VSRIAVGIPSYKRPDRLQVLLDALASVDDGGHEVAVFVADNDPVDSAAAVLCQGLSNYVWPLTAKVVAEPGISAARNAILEYALAGDFDFVAMIDDDERPTRSWLVEMLQMMALTNADVCGGPVEYEFDGPIGGALLTSGAFPPPRERALPHSARLLAPEGGLVEVMHSTANVMLRCETLRRAPFYFDLQFGLTGGGDKEFFSRAKGKGFTFAWAEGAAVIETVPASRITERWVLNRAYRLGNSDVRLHLAHKESSAVAREVAKALSIFLAAPVLALNLINADRRLQVLRKFYRAAGKIAAVVGHSYAEYAIDRKARS
jgi:succinoglycan biosynthesis protein ExoM